MHDHGDRGAGPHAADDGVPPERFQSKGNRCVSAGDEQEDIEMVDAAQHVGHARRPVAQMVGRGVGEQHQRADHEHRARPLERRPLRQTDQHDARRQ